jgi:starch synthase
MRVIHISAECFPIAKVGGLADVVGALPKYQNNLGISASVVMPYYSNIYTKNSNFNIVYKGTLKLGYLHYDFQILELESGSVFPLFLVRIVGLLERENVYAYDDDTERFLAFQIAVLNWILQLSIKPSVVHCHDYHTGFIPFMMSHSKKYTAIKDIPTVFTIHNAQYQGQFGHDKIDYFPEFDLSNIGLLDWDDLINPLATAIKCAWKVTTVSPGYLEELKINANGLEGLLRHESEKCSGILNGIDLKVWNPETDNNIEKKYSEKTVQL